MVTQLEIAISQLIVGFVTFWLGMILEHLINERRWKLWITRIKRLEKAGFWDDNERLSVELALNERDSSNV